MMGYIKNFFNTIKREPININKGFRVGMWVVTPNNGIGIIFKLGDNCEVHIVDNKTGETKEIISASLASLRQCSWNEIPECRRGISKSEAEALGYGS